MYFNFFKVILKIYAMTYQGNCPLIYELWSIEHHYFVLLWLSITISLILFILFNFNIYLLIIFIFCSAALQISLPEISDRYDPVAINGNVVPTEFPYKK